MKLPHLIIIAASVLVVSCQKENKVDSAVANDSVAANASKAVQPNAGNVAAQNTAVTTGMLNPEHGQPNHRCDIAVGAPLNSAPAAIPAPAAAPQQMPVQNQFNTNPIAPQSVNNTGPKPALNPAHGAPHHRCDLEVGAPLT